MKPRAKVTPAAGGNSGIGRAIALWAAAEGSAIAREAAAMLNSYDMTPSACKSHRNPRTLLRLGSLALLLRR